MTTIPINGRDIQLSYSANVHPGESADDLLRILSQDIPAVRDRVFPGSPLGAAPRLGMRQVDELAQSTEKRDQVLRALDENDLFIFNINAFPLTEFHADRVKEDVYRPPWNDPARADYTIKIADLLADWLPEGMAGSISVPTGGFRAWGDSKDDHRAMGKQIARVAEHLAKLREERGVEIILGLEPEPATTAETTEAFIRYYEQAVAGGAADEDAVRGHVGVCYDICHQAVQFETPAESLAALESAGIRLACVHISAAARVIAPGDNSEGMRLLAELDEPRYLHQTYAADAGGQVVMRDVDLPEHLGRPSLETAELSEVRTHFHMPLFMEPDGKLGTTRVDIEAALAVILERDLCRHLLLETYTWSVMQTTGVDGAELDLTEALAREFRWVLEKIKKL